MTRASLLTALLLAATAASAQPAASPAAGAAPVLLVVERFEVVGPNPLDAAATAAALAPHLGEHRTLATLEGAAVALESRLRERGHAFHRVILPAQRPSGGVVRLEVLAFPLSTVAVTGNRHFSSDNVLRSLPGLVPGAAPDMARLSSELGLANEHASKRLSLVLKEARGADALEAEVRVRDTPPAQWFAALTGHTRDAYDVINQNTGYTRATFGYQNTNLFDRDHALTLTYTTSPDHTRLVQQFGAFYWLPLYGHALSAQFYYTRSDIDTGAVGVGAATFNVSGRGEFIGARVTRALPRWGELMHNAAIALDDRLFESNVGFAGVNILPGASRTRPLTLRYAARWEQPWGGLAGYAEHASNLDGGSGNTDLAYAAARTGARRDWSALRYGMDASYSTGRWNWVARLRGQVADKVLLPGEQFGLGGAQQVRGLREREFTGDSGYAFALEAQGPLLEEGFRPVFFIDGGRAELRGGTTLAGTSAHKEGVLTAGVGVRWNWRRALDVSADLAYVFDGTASTPTVPGSRGGDAKLHFAIFYRF
jgi:hemolysin activation/secretion protein